MTCIVAIVRDGKVYMGCDSLASAGYASIARKDRKIYRVGGMLMGFTTSFRMGQLLGYSLVVPAIQEDDDVGRWMCTKFVDACRECFKAGGYTKTENGREEGGDFLVAFKARIFEVYSDFQVGESTLGIASVGSGAGFALGAMHAMHSQIEEGGSPSHTPHSVIGAALNAAEEFSSGVRGPFHVEILE